MKRRGFTLVELLMVGVVLVLIGLMMAPMMKKRWNADGLTESFNNVRQILVACGEYRLDNANRVPMRATSYSNGQITGGWDTWNFAGRHCDTFWQGGPFDEMARHRFLNPYLQSNLAPMPIGSVNAGSGATWTFIQGSVTQQQRAAFNVKVCRSPGDIRSYQQSWPTPSPGVSSYKDVGTSYHLNMRWWDQPGGPTAFTTKYNAGTQGISNLPGVANGRVPSDFVWIHDQVAQIVSSNLNVNIPGEFEGTNMSVLGYLDGRAAYRLITPGTISGLGYTFGFPWP